MMTYPNKGFSLVEVLIALTIGIFLSLGATQLFSASSATTRLQQALSEVSEAGRFTASFIGTDLQKAGYSPSVALTDFLQGVNGVNGGNDSVTVSYDGVISNNRDCVGNEVVGNVVNRYLVIDRQLQCNGITLVDEVESFQVLYGIDTDNSLTPNYYSVEPNGGNDVVAVRIGILIRSKNNAQARADQVFNVLDEVVAPEADGFLRRLFTKSVLIRNSELDEVFF